MKILFHNLYNGLNYDNRLFEYQIGSNDNELLEMYRILDSLARNKGADVGTFSKINKEDADVFVFIDMPDDNDKIFQYAIQNNAVMYLLAMESPFIHTRSFLPKYHQFFKKVFTWSDDLIAINSQKYIKINYTCKMEQYFKEGYRSKICVIISGNKHSKARNELYSERLKCIHWFNRNAPSALDIYGPNWDLFLINSNNVMARIFNKTNRKYKIFPANLKGYKGTIKKKGDVLSQYNFSICLENGYGYAGYITEKILDCLVCGTIPIYKGASNITKYIPASCFINYDDFSNVSDLHKFMTSISPDQIIEYQKNIKIFLQSENFKPFLSTTFADTILSNIL